MAFDAQAILEKAKKEAEEKAAKAAEAEKNAKVAEEKRKAEEQAKREELARLEAECREQERLQREAEQKRKEEAAKREKEEQERKEAEEKRQLELEKARIAEEVHQKAIQQRKTNTQNCANDMQKNLNKMTEMINRKETDYYKINNLYDESNGLLNKDVDYNQIEILNQYKNALNDFNSLRLKAISKKNKKEKRQQRAQRAAIIIPCIVALCALVFGIYKLANRPKKQYVVGGRGQGGIIFYDKGEYTDGWRYLEVSINRLTDRYWADDSEVNYMSGLKSGLGNGDFNTDNIIRVWGTDSAAWDARNYNGGGYTDWYLPTRDEMQLVYKVVGKKYGKKLQKKIPGFDYVNYGNWNTANWKDYWTSEMSSPGKAYKFDCNNIGGDSREREITTYVFMKKTYYSKNYVRPVRKF